MIVIIFNVTIQASSSSSLRQEDFLLDRFFLIITVKQGKRLIEPVEVILVIIIDYHRIVRLVSSKYSHVPTVSSNRGLFFHCYINSLGLWEQFRLLLLPNASIPNAESCHTVS